MSTPFTLCVYCGSRHGTDPAFTAAARAVGQLIGERGWRLVYGGGNVGLMGEVADATLAAGGQVIGVIPELLLQKEVGHRQLTELEVVQTMHQRKQRMAELADAFVALPGGIGTFEELFEVWTWRHIGYHDQPIGLLNTSGFYDPLLTFMKHTLASGFIDGEQQRMLTVDAEPARLLSELAAQSKNATQSDDFRRI
ncbi:MAG: Rossman fold protein, TIGR00730 family [Burkholderiales bacterium PBB6]|jgi:uncharacterized protein (TIGR00730 family)|uniref:Cytokinin riboside 5'-monophosphate phosphoribohydrolase n=1 Tax=Ideonella margarita TaxID=2984191 RepID=A0ABU9C2A0_9BURK|nr:MAG: Rossman fold protein, TIGR00730 family [Burkholderiales bacterium PBB6]